MRILQATNLEDSKILKAKSLPIEDVHSEDTKKAVSALFQAVMTHKCLGVALPQIGINRRIIAIKRANKREILILINPRIEAAKGTVKFKEGCLSLPGLNVNVERAKEILVDYTDIKGNNHTLSFDGIEAICIQHEIDHLDGILMTKHGLPFKGR